MAGEVTLADFNDLKRELQTANDEIVNLRTQVSAARADASTALAAAVDSGDEPHWNMQSDAASNEYQSLWKVSRNASNGGTVDIESGGIVWAGKLAKASFNGTTAYAPAAGAAPNTSYFIGVRVSVDVEYGYFTAVNLPTVLDSTASGLPFFPGPGTTSLQQGPNAVIYIIAYIYYNGDIEITRIDQMLSGPIYCPVEHSFDDSAGYSRYEATLAIRYDATGLGAPGPAPAEVFTF